MPKEKIMRFLMIDDDEDDKDFFAEALKEVDPTAVLTSKFSENIFSSLETNELYFFTKPTRIEELKQYLNAIMQKTKSFIHTGG